MHYECVPQLDCVLYDLHSETTVGEALFTGKCVQTSKAVLGFSLGLAL